MQVADRQKPAPGELFLDHVAHFVPDLDAAAAVFESVGFAVTPRSVHMVEGKPAGTSNRCVMLEQGYIEILAPTHDTPGAARVRERMAKFVGLHLACFGTPDAEAEQRRLAERGFEPPPLENLQREAGTVRFRVVRPRAESMPEGRIQYVQHMTPEQIWKAEYLRHTNAVLGLSALYIAASDVAETAARWASFAGLLPRRDGDFVYLETARGSVFVGPGSEQAIVGYALRCKDAGRFLARCKAAGLDVTKDVVALPSQLGGAWFVV